MEKNNLLMLVVTLTVGIILAGSLLMPVLSDATTTERTFTNTGAFYIDADPTDTYTIAYNKASEPGVIYINGDALDIAFSNSYTVFSIDNAIMRTISDNTLQWKGNGQYMTGISKVDLTVSNGSVTGTYIGVGGNETSWPTTTYTECHIASPTREDLVMTSYNSTNKVLGDSDIFAFGQTAVKNNTVMLLFKITGNVKDGVEITALNSTTGDVDASATITDISVNATAVNGYRDLYDLTSITFKVEYDSTVTDATYTAYIVPTTVTAELSQHLNAGEIALLNALPILVIIGLVMVGVGAILVRNRD